MKKIKLVIVVAILFTAFSIVIAATNEQAKKEKPKAREDLYSQVELFSDSISIIKTDYVDEVEPKKLIYGALKGMLASLDDFSQFMEPEEFKEIKQETKGEFGGIGIEISIREGILTIITPIASTPAEAAGIKAGDKIVKIDGKLTKSMSLNDAVKLMRGDPGTLVTLTIWRDKEEKVMDVPIKRAIIKVNSIKKASLIEDKIGYVKLVEFQENTPRDLDIALKKMEQEGMDSLILDLRNNPGGLLDVSADVAERFLAKDMTIVSIKARNPAMNEVFKSSGRFFRSEYPLVVMVNEGSASAAEIVAGAIQDNKRGIVLGNKTFGKASVQTVIPLKDGSALRLTTATYVTPNGKIIRNQGIAPDVVIDIKEGAEKKKSEAEEIFEKVDEKDKQKEKSPLEGDSQLQSAVNLIKAIRVYKAAKI